MIIPTNPEQLDGNWTDGYALDKHILKSVFLGEDPNGRPQFNTERTQLGESLYRLKYRFDKTQIDDISETVCDFIRTKWSDVDFDYILPVPPSRRRATQPVIEVTTRVSEVLEISLSENDIEKHKITSQLKDIKSYSERVDVLGDSFQSKTDNLVDKTTLILDDLYSTGATLNVLTDFLYNNSQVKEIYVLTLTRTK